MPTYPYQPSTIGTYKRTYDTLSEKNSEEESVAISEILDWLQEDPTKKKSKSKTKDYAQKLIESRLEKSDSEFSGPLSALSTAGNFLPSVAENTVAIGSEIYHATRDFFAGRRTKTSTLIVSGIVLGAAVGFVVGTFVLPGVGSAVGGAAGAALTAGLISVGGAIGLSLLGAVGGSWIATKISQSIFKNEKRYELSNRITKRIKKYLGLRSKEAEMVNGYLTNRIKAVESPAAKQYYKYLRKLLIQKPEDLGLKKGVDFFRHELKLLERERTLNGSTPELEQEIKAVVHILKIFSGRETRGLLIKTKNELKNLCATYETPAVTKPKSNAAPATTGSPASANSTASSSDGPDVEVVQREFENTLSQHNYRTQKTSSSGDSRGDFFSHYEIYKDQQKVTEVDVSHHTSDGVNQYQFTIAVDVFMADKEECLNVLVLEARAYYQKTGDASPTIIAARDDSIAVRLMAAAIKADLTPVLDASEYPEDTLENRKRKHKVIEDAYTFAGKIPPDSRPAKRPTLS